MDEFECLSDMNIHTLATGLRFPEGPAFAADGTLWCVEQEGESLFFLQPDGQQGRVELGKGSRPNGLYIDSLGRLWFCDSGQNAIRCYNPSAGATETILDRVDGEPLQMPNDIIRDGAGNLIFTCPGPSGAEARPNGYVCVCTPVGEVFKIAEGLFYPNGLALLPDGYTLLISETHRKRIWYGYWDPNAEDPSWEHPSLWVNTGEEGDGPDGLAVGPDEHVYVAIYGSPCVQVYDATGKLLREISLPGGKPTNVACDPMGRLGMVITEAERGELLSIAL